MAINMAISQNGEHFRKLSDDFKSQFGNFPWPDVRHDRNKIVHHYKDVTVEDTQYFMINDVPALNQFCKTVINDLQIDYQYYVHLTESEVAGEYKWSTSKSPKPK
jgi:uncharacterized protein with HEPN domain